MSPPSASVAEAWRLQAEWSARATHLKNEIARARTTVLTMVVSVAVLETLGAVLLSTSGAAITAGRIVIALGAVLAAIAAWVQARGAEEKQVAQWTRSRSASEAFKEAVYRYCTKTGAYDTDDPESVLRARSLSIVNDVKDLQAVVLPATPVTKEPPPHLDLGAYIDRRVRQQVERYYEPQAQRLGQRRDQWRRAQQVLLVVAAALGALVALWPQVGLAPWVAVMTTMAGAVGAHVEAGRYNHLIVAYRSTANRLRALMAEYQDRGPGAASDFAALVDRAEEAISVENQSWMAGWTGRG